MATDGNSGEARAAMSRKEKRKLLKKEKRKQVRKEIAVREKEEEESRCNDSEVQCKLRQLEQEELERMERDRLEFEERERRFLEALELRKKREQEEFVREEERERERQKLAEESGTKQVDEENSKEVDDGSDWEYVEEGPAEIIWQGNEIIVKKKIVKVPRKNLEQQNRKEGVVRPISNPLAPESESFETYKSAQDILDTVAQQVPNFGTEQDKAHCPFHLKTGACRFGTRCSRVHFYPDKSCTMLMKNMYGGPGLAWEQDEGLEHTDEEIDRSFEEFYEDVHTEFLKFGEMVNFKVCRNGSPHLRGNVYVHYKSLESAVRAYHSTNGRYFAGKQVICEFVNVTRWKIAICGEFMKSRLKRCSRGSACNFIHCFQNPGGDYEWADWDRPPPRYWIEKMDALFGYEDGYNKQLDEVNYDKERSATESIRMDANRRRPRSRSRERDSKHTRSHNADDDNRRSKGQQWKRIHKEREHSLDRDRNEEKCGKGNRYVRGKSPNAYTDDDQSIKELKRMDHERYYAHKKSHSRSRWHRKNRSSESDSDRGCSAKEKGERYHEDYRSHRKSKQHSNGRSPGSDSDRERSVRDGWERNHEDRTHSRQKKRDSGNTEYECDSKDETLQNDPEGIYHADTLGKHHKSVHRSVKHQGDNFDTCRSDSHEDSVVKHREGYHMKRRRTSRGSKNEMGFSDSDDDDDVGDGYDSCENEYYRYTKERSNLETESKNKHGKRESSKHRKRERSHKYERRSSRRHRKDDVGSHVTLFGKEEGSERIHAGRKESLWDQNKAEEDHVVTADEGHHEIEVCEERHNPEKHGRLENAEIDEGNGCGRTSPQKTMGGERTGDGHLSKQDYSGEVEIENEKACRRAALEKLQEKQLQKQLSSNSGNLKNPKTISCNLEESAAITTVDKDQNDSEAEPRMRRRI